MRIKGLRSRGPIIFEGRPVVYDVMQPEALFPVRIKFPGGRYDFIAQITSVTTQTAVDDQTLITDALITLEVKPNGPVKFTPKSGRLKKRRKR